MTKILITLGILVALIALVLYLRIGERIAVKWYIPKVQAIAIDSLINLREKDLDEIEKDMRWKWPLWGPFEAVSRCMIFRFTH